MPLPLFTNVQGSREKRSPALLLGAAVLAMSLLAAGCGEKVKPPPSERLDLEIIIELTTEPRGAEVTLADKASFEMGRAPRRHVIRIKRMERLSPEAPAGQSPYRLTGVEGAGRDVYDQVFELDFDLIAKKPITTRKRFLGSGKLVVNLDELWKKGQLSYKRHIDLK